MVFAGSVDYTLTRIIRENPPMSLARHRAISLILMMLLVGPIASADEVQVRPDQPERYVVQKGDTLWDIATKFLNTPWHWPRIWKINEQIKNPHLIYPGDVIVMRWVDGKPELALLRAEKAAPADSGQPTVPAVPAAPGEPAPAPSDGRTVKLSPRIHASDLEAAIPTIPPDAIAPFLSRPLVVGKRELDEAGYITVGLEGRIALADGSEFYARGLKRDAEQEYYFIVRHGKALRHPETNEVLAYEAQYLGEAQMLEPGDPAKLVVTKVEQEILPTDRLMLAPKRAGLPHYYPHAPKNKVRGYIINSPNSISEIGSFTVVTLSLGEREGIEEGHVLRIMRHAGTHRDPVRRSDYKLPDEQSGLLMVFRTFEKVSYGLVMNSIRPVNLNDAVVTP